MTTWRPTITHPSYDRLLKKAGLIPVLGAALLLVGTALATVQAAPPEQSPTGKPSAQRGEALWSENCAPCHGILGGGDGPTSQMAQMVDNPPTDFTDLTAARKRSLTDIFVVTKQGRMDRLMPPWGGRLSDDQIWDVAAYAQTFAMHLDDIAVGEAIYDANCITCHAADGSGTVSNTVDFGDAAVMSSQSPQVLFDAISQGQGEMPAFDDRLSEEERWQVVDYVRSLSYAPVASDGVIVGQVQNATTGLPVGEVAVRLRRWQTESELPPLDAQADTDGNFRFEGLDTQSHAFYRLEVTYDGISFPSDFTSFEPGAVQLSLLASVYETTTSDEDIGVERFHFIVIGDQPGFLSILELYQFSNSGDRAYVGSQSESGSRETVRIALPTGAQELVLQNGTLGVDLLETDEGLAATSPVLPGQESFEIAFVYVVPYSGASLDLGRPLYYETASINGLIMDVGATLESEALAFDGERAAQGQNFLQYTAQDLRAGETLPIRLEGLDKIDFPTAPEPSARSSVMPSTGLSQTTLLWMMLGLGALAIAFVLAYPWLQPRITGEARASGGDLVQERQRLLLTLTRLDQAYEAGELNQAVYRRARTRRKAELADIWRRMQEDET